MFQKNSKPELVRRFFPLFLIGFLVSIFPSKAISENVSPAQPNIVFFFVDDMGWQDTSVPFHGERTELNDRYRTPNMERLADSGMKFTQAYACALCSPTRISLMTGLNAARHGVTNWTLRKNKSPDPDHATLEIPPWNVNGLSPEEGIEGTVCATILPSLLRESGYRTIHVGKAHFGAAGTPGEEPKNLGFDINIAGHAPGGPGSYHGIHNFSAAWRNGDRIWDVPGLEKYHGEEIHLTEALTREAIEVVEETIEDRVPFYLYFSHYAIHAPWEKDDRYFQEYRDRGLNEFEATYASMIEGMDRSLGDILDLLDRLGVADNTIVLFMSDNGAPKQAPRNLPLRGHKLTAYEGGVRVPLIVKWPGVVEEGSNQETYVMVEDLFPTILEMGGADPKKSEANPKDGVSFVPLLKQSGEYPEDRAIFWHYPHCYDQPPTSSIRLGDWKLIFFYEDSHFELYNLEEDLSEERNLYSEHPDVAENLSSRLQSFLAEAGAKTPRLKATGEAIALTPSSK